MTALQVKILYRGKKTGPNKQIFMPKCLFVLFCFALLFKNFFNGGLQLLYCLVLLI